MRFSVVTGRPCTATVLRALVVGTLGAMLAGTVALFAAGPEGRLGQIDVPGWIDAVPSLPSSPQEATVRAYGRDINAMPFDCARSSRRWAASRRSRR